MKISLINRKGIVRSVLGAALSAFCGLLLWKTPVGEPWIRASYDDLFRFATRGVTNTITFIMMDNEAYDHFRQTRGQPWDRGLHAQLLNKLADDNCPLVVMDCFFRQPQDGAKDEALAKAMRRLQKIVLMAEQAQITNPNVEGLHSLLPAEPFYSASRANWGIAWLDSADPDLIIRRHWPFPAPGPYPSLAETAARLEGAQLAASPQERWVRYYGREGAWPRLSYGAALAEPANYFRNQIVFIGTYPNATTLEAESDKFRTPYTRWTDETTGGTQIMLTCFLNLVNNDWLRRADKWMEALILVFSGMLLGGGLCRMSPARAFACAVVLGITVVMGAVSCSYFTNYWFPWLIIAGGQTPCALAWAFVARMASRTSESIGHFRDRRESVAVIEKLPEIPGYDLHPAPFGKGAYGKVWLARNSDLEWRALKMIYLKNFDNDIGPFEREFNGISRYQPVSDKHPSLLRVEFVSEKLDGWFYYVMELGDSLAPGWEREPATYKPRDLTSECARMPGGRLPARECLRIGLELSDALDFLHRQGLTHRDIKPQNIIFVNGRPKLADLGLISEIRPPDQPRTLVGTPGYMPPPPELPGTPQADIYALGVVLYVLSAGRQPAFFPDISTTLAQDTQMEEFFTVNNIVLKACQPDPTHRYASALEMHLALQEAQEALAGSPRVNLP